MKNSQGAKSIFLLPKIKVSSLRNYTGGAELYAHAFLRTRTFVDTPLIYFVGLCLFVFLFDILSCMCPAAKWSPTGKGLNSRRFCIDVFLCFCHFPLRCPGSGVVPDCIDS